MTQQAALSPARGGCHSRVRLALIATGLPAGVYRGVIDSSWGFFLKELPGGRTALLLSGYAASHPRALTAIGDLLFWEPAGDMSSAGVG